MTRIVIGTIVLGRTDAVGDQHVETTFLMVGAPILPLRTELVTGRRIAPVGGLVALKSVLLGYSRFYLAFATIIASILLLDTRRRLHLEDLAPAAILLASWLVATFVLGRLSAGEKRRRALLGAATGLNIDPRSLEAEERRRVFKRLERQWKLADPDEDWRECLDGASTDPELALTAHALAAYAGAVERTTATELEVRKGLAGARSGAT